LCIGLILIPLGLHRPSRFADAFVRQTLPEWLVTTLHNEVAASGRTRIPRIVSRSDHLLHDRVQILQPSRTAERLAAHIDVVGYRVVAEVDCGGEGAQPIREVELVPRHFAIVVCVREFSMHMRVKPKAVRKQLRVQLQ
jgi:hypothetical protein